MIINSRPNRDHDDSKMLELHRKRDHALFPNQRMRKTAGTYVNGENGWFELWAINLAFSPCSLRNDRGGIRTLATHGPMDEAWYSRGACVNLPAAWRGLPKVLLTVPSIRPPSFPADQGFKITNVNHRSLLWMRFLCFRIRYPVYNSFHSPLNTNPPLDLLPSIIHETRLILQ